MIVFECSLYGFIMIYTCTLKLVPIYKATLRVQVLFCANGVYWLEGTKSNAHSAILAEFMAFVVVLQAFILVSYRCGNRTGVALCYSGRVVAKGLIVGVLV